jgi:glycosyltransferase involved in cell wall biosynthesis
MNILVLAKKMPYPKRDGESIAIDVLSGGLREEGASLDLLAMNTSKHYSKEDPELLTNHPFNSISLIPVDNKIKALDAFKNLFSTDSYHISRFVSDKYKAKLEDLLKANEYDIIQLETVYMCAYIDVIRKHSPAKIILRAHNVEHEIWERVIKNETNPIKSLYLRYLNRKLKRFEIAALNDIDLLLPISSKDEQNFVSMGFRGESKVVPIGIKPHDSDLRSSYKSSISFGFIGSLDWVPNQEGLSWFVEEIWKPFVKSNPGYIFNIAGRNTPEWIMQANWPGTKVHGEVDSAEAFTADNEVMVVPLLSGSGMRAKILEALSLGRNVITTNVGLEGIDVKDLNAVYVADKPEEFIDYLNQLIRQNGEVQSHGLKARSFILEAYNYRKVAASLFQIYSKCIRK